MNFDIKQPVEILREKAPLFFPSKQLALDTKMMKLLSFLLIIVMVASAFSKPPVAAMKMTAGSSCCMKGKQHKPACSKESSPGSKHTNGTFCYYCVLFVGFIIPAKAGINQNFVATPAEYPDMAQSKLTDYNPSCWRPPNA